MDGVGRRNIALWILNVIFQESGGRGEVSCPLWSALDHFWGEGAKEGMVGAVQAFTQNISALGTAMLLTLEREDSTLL